MSSADAVIEQIKALVINGDLVAGQRLPPEAQLAAQLGTSRNALREAVRALATLNILDVRQGDGTYVTSLDSALLLENMSFAADLGRGSSVSDFLEVRRLMEPHAAALAAVRMAASDKQELSLMLDDVDVLGSVESFVAHDIAFHERIALGAGNDVLASLLGSLAGPTQRTRIWRGVAEQSAVPRTLIEHRAICDAIIEGDASLASAQAQAHVAGVQRFVRCGASSVSKTRDCTQPSRLS